MAADLSKQAECEDSGATENAWTLLPWSAPLFFLGLIALSVAIGFHFLIQSVVPSPPRTRVAAAALRKLLRQPLPGRDQLAGLSDEVAELADSDKSAAGEAHFLAGSGYLRLAEQTPDIYLAPALAHLQQAEALGVSEEDAISLRYRLAIALGRAHADPRQVIDYLSSSAEQTADNPAEGYGLLMNACLNVRPPDLEGALAANAALLQLPTNDDKLLAPVRLLRGQLLLQLQRGAEAREVLKRIRAPAPLEIQAQALDLLAHSLEDDGLWAEAVKVWQDWLGRSDVPRNASRIGYFLGRCYLRLDQPVDAVQTWEKALPTAAGEERVAIGFALAELHLQQTAGTAALEGFVQGLRDVKNAGEWPETLLSIARARQQMEAAATIYLDAGEYECAAQLARLYEKIALTGRGQELLGRARDKAAQALVAAAEAAGNDAEKKERQEEARARFREAGAAYEAAAELTSDPVEQARRLWCSGDRYFKGQEFARAAAALERFTQSGQLPETQGEAWYLLGKSQLAQKQSDHALKAFAESLNHRGSFEYKARLELALIRLSRKELDLAKDFLDRNISLLRQGLPDKDAYIGSLIALGDLLFQRDAFGEAAGCLQEASDNAGLGDNLDARQELIECYRQLAARQVQQIDSGERKDPEAFKHAVELHRKWLQAAAREAQSLTNDLLLRRAKSPPIEREERCYCWAAFVEAEARLHLGEYTAARQQFEALAARYHHKPESLRALALIATCYSIERRTEEVKVVFDRMRQALVDIVFTDDKDWGREQWQKWIDEQAPK